MTVLTPLAAEAALSLNSSPTAVTPAQNPAKSASPKQSIKPSSKVTPISPIAGARVRDPVWDACISSMGAVPSNDAERGKWAKGIKSLKQSLLAAVPPGVTSITTDMAAVIGVRAARYRARFGAGVPLNPMALAGNWSALATDLHDITHPSPTQEGHHHATNQRRYGSYKRDTGKPAVGTPAYYAQAAAQTRNVSHATGGPAEGRDAVAFGRW